MAEISDLIEVMLKQEQSSYLTRDYMDESHQQKITKQTKDCDQLADVLAGSLSVSTSAINEYWREKICEWCYQVVDHFEFSREVASVAMNYLDRFLATKTVNKKVFQLAAMTSLFIAVKLFEPGRIGMSAMIGLSRGYFSVEQMAAMEMALLRTLKWKVHPPTPYTFVKCILKAVSVPSLTLPMRRGALELSRFFTELSVIDYYFIAHKSSDIALASLLNAVEILGSATENIAKTFGEEVARRTTIDVERPEVLECRHRLHLLYVQGEYDKENQAESEPRNDSVSPVCVSHGCINTCRADAYYYGDE